MKTLKGFFPQIFGGIASGLMIGIGGTVLLSCEDRYIGAILFTIALLTICFMDFYLYTGRIGFAAEGFEKKTAVQLAVGLVSNFVGATLMGLIIRYARPALIEKAAASCDSKLRNGVLRAFVLGCLCGVLMYVAVKTFRQNKTVLGVIFCIPVFILAGFEHSIADMFYFALAGMINIQYIGFIIAVILGNSVGALVIAALFRLKNVNAERG